MPQTPTFTCNACGAEFTLPQPVLDRYPGWTPKVCRSCRDGGGDGDGGGGGGARAGGGGGRARAGAGGGRARAGGAGVEENLTIAEVLAKYHRGPADGVFTDGSAHPNPGPGGWGAVYVRDGEVIGQRHGHEPHTTNNRMELTALIAGYDLVPDGVPATVYTDSKLCVDTITKWAAGWKRRGWKRKSGEVQNLDLVKTLYERAESRPDIELRWIKAHDGSRWNEYADALSTAYRRAEL